MTVHHVRNSAVHCRPRTFSSSMYKMSSSIYLESFCSALLLCLSLVICKIDDNDLIFKRKSPRDADFALNASPFHRLSCSQELRCMAECQARRDVCRGINFAASRRECHLLSVTSNDATLEARAGFTYYEVRSVSYLKTCLIVFQNWPTEACFSTNHFTEAVARNSSLVFHWFLRINLYIPK